MAPRRQRFGGQVKDLSYAVLECDQVPDISWLGAPGEPTRKGQVLELAQTAVRVEAHPFRWETAISTK